MAPRSSLVSRLLLVAVASTVVNLSFTGGPWRPSQQRSSITLAATKEEAKVLKLCDEFPVDADADDKEELLKAIKKLPGTGRQESYDRFVGDWKVEWSTLGGRAFQKRKGGGDEPPMTLKFVSFTALPAAPVQFTGSYNRVSGTPTGGTYQLLQTFTLPDNKEGTEAAMVLEGTWSTGDSEGNWGRGAPRTRVPTEFQTVRLVPSIKDEDKSRAMLEAAGLGKYFERTPVKAKATYIDLQHVSEEMRLHQGESGQMYILSKIGDGEIPFVLDQGSFLASFGEAGRSKCSLDLRLASPLVSPENCQSSSNYQKKLEASEGLGLESLPDEIAKLQPKDGCFARVALTLEWPSVNILDENTFEVPVAATGRCPSHPHPLLYLCTSEDDVYVVIIPWHGAVPVRDQDIFLGCTDILRGAQPLDENPFATIRLYNLDVRRSVRQSPMENAAAFGMPSESLHAFEFSSLSVSSGRVMLGKLQKSSLEGELCPRLPQHPEFSLLQVHRSEAVCGLFVAERDG
ncbi:unnamed protein product [Symbiodinium sp. CCMP2592]|nr:unnamed protein product [Symbiodinium sp. CCMP2592]